MNKRINVKPVSTIELAFEDGTIIEMKFDAEAIMNISSMEGGISSIMKMKSITEACAKIIYAGTTSTNTNITLEEARKIVSNLDIGTITEIMEEFSDNAYAGKTNEEKKELQKNLMREFLSTLK